MLPSSMSNNLIQRAQPPLPCQLRLLIHRKEFNCKKLTATLTWLSLQRELILIALATGTIGYKEKKKIHMESRYLQIPSKIELNRITP